jgi:hypothetical protein
MLIGVLGRLYLANILLIWAERAKEDLTRHETLGFVDGNNG